MSMGKFQGFIIFYLMNCENKFLIGFAYEILDLCIIKSPFQIFSEFRRNVCRISHCVVYINTIYHDFLETFGIVEMVEASG